MNVQETIAHLNTLTTVEAVEQAIAEESRSTVLKHANELIASLKANAATGDDEAAAAGADHTNTTAGEQEQANDAGEGADTEAAAPAPPAAPAPKAQAAPTVQGKGGKPAPKAKYIVVAPDAPGKVGFGGHLYTRKQIAADPALQEKLYKNGCRVVRRVP